MLSANILAIESEILSTPTEKRYIIIDIETGQVLDDSGGAGYKSTAKAYSSYEQKLEANKNKEILVHKNIIKWLNTHQNFANLLEEEAMQALNDKTGKKVLNAEKVEELLKQNNIKFMYSAEDLLTAWKKWR